MTRYFGTDGVRGVANKELTCEMAFTLGMAAVELLGARLVIGRDTRRSGPMLEAALVAGITSAGGDALLAGIAPTPAVALLIREFEADGGVVISASHNPPEYNGIKFFDAEGFKLTQELEDAFEARLQALDEVPSQVPGKVRLQASDRQKDRQKDAFLAPITGTAVGTVIPLEGAGERYIAHAMSVVCPRGASSSDLPDASSDASQTPAPDASSVTPAVTPAAPPDAPPAPLDTPLDTPRGIDLTGLRIAVDCGHGASFATTPETLRRLGATVEAINTDFNGDDINVGCGSTDLRQLKELVAETGADIGIAHDGDADRMLAVDEAGNELDGDIIEAICAIDLKGQGKLARDTVVSTVVCNLGFISAMRDRGIEVIQTAVGDRHVLAAMREDGFVLGGEQSGHLILLEYNSTGDGLASALQLIAAMRRADKTLGHLAKAVTRYPQIFINVTVSDKEGLGSSADLTRAIREVEGRLGDQGRVLIRASGTEPLVRVMVEAADEQIARDEAQLLASVVGQELG
jgi:phosphoglucosamine mutase